jgi:CubicO group peptidase (beta-lactamase class C family)
MERREEQNTELAQALRYFTRETRIMDGMAAVCGRGEQRAWARDGAEISGKTIFDLASVTKLFTGLTLMRLWEMGELDPFRRVSFYCPDFPCLRTVTVEQVMGFQVSIQTPERVDRQPDRERALACLRQAFPAGPSGRRAYSDMPAMVLKYVAEAASGLPMMECVRQLILNPAGMQETFAKVPDDRREDCLLYGPEYRIEKGNRICRRDPVRGVPHDPKAALVQGGTEDLCGHAGLFSTLEDLEKLARALLDGRLLSRESLRRMAVNRTGRMLPDGTRTQYLGYQCYLKHPDQYYSEIPAAMSGEAFGIGGFTGNHFSVDPGTGRYTVFLGNRVRGRLTVLIPEEGKTLEDYGLRADGTGEIRWTDGTSLPSSVNYVHQKDRHLHAAAERILGPAPREKRNESMLEEGRQG